MAKILVVDDEPNIIEILEMVLRDEKMEVFKTGSAREALAILQEREVDLVISDIRMPGFSGVELLREAKKVSPETTFIMITAFASTENGEPQRTVELTSMRCPSSSTARLTTKRPRQARPPHELR